MHVLTIRAFIILLRQLKVTWLPAFANPRFKWFVKSQQYIPAFTGHGCLVLIVFSVANPRTDPSRIGLSTGPRGSQP